MSRPRILLADDHANILERVSELLSTEFEIVAIVRDGLAAVDAAAALEPDLAVLDISMPILNGLEVARRLTAIHPSPRIVFLTVHEDVEYREAARSAGACGYVLKRSLATELLPAIKRALGYDAPASDRTDRVEYVSPRA